MSTFFIVYNIIILIIIVSLYIGLSIAIIRKNYWKFKYDNISYDASYYKKLYDEYLNGYNVYRNVFELSMVCCNMCGNKDNCDLLKEILKRLEVAEIDRMYNLK